MTDVNGIALHHLVVVTCRWGLLKGHTNTFTISIRILIGLRKSATLNFVKNEYLWNLIKCHSKSYLIVSGHNEADKRMRASMQVIRISL